MLQALPDTRYQQLTGILERYISRSTAAAMLQTVIEDNGISPERMTPEDLAKVVEEVMVGLRLFCNPRRLPDLMIELAELCDREADLADMPPSQSAPASAHAEKPRFP